MTFQAIVTLVILMAALLVLATRRLRPDITALCVTLALVLTGVLDPAEAFSAFGQPVIIIIPCIYIMGAAISETGVATVLSDRLLGISDKGPALLILVIMGAAGLLSSVLSSLLVVAALMPAVLRIARKARLAPAQMLLPLVAGATMGNLLTAIGTVSTLVVGDLLVASGYEPLGFFAITPFGLVSLILAILWYALAGRRRLPREAPVETLPPSLDEVEDVYALESMLHRLRIRSASDLIAVRLDESDLSTAFQLNVVAIQAEGSALRPASPEWILEHNNLLIVEGSLGSVLQAAGMHHLEAKGSMSLDEFNLLEQESLRLAEVMVPFRSKWVGKSLEAIRFRLRYGLNVLALHRQGQPLQEDLLQSILAAGDTLLVQGPLGQLRRVGQDLNLVMVTYLGPRPGDLVTSKAKLVLVILAAMLVCVLSGWLSLATASLAAVLALLLTRCLSPERAYRSIDGRVIVLVGGMLPLAMALEKTGTAELIAQQLAGLGPSIGATGTLLVLYLFTALLTQVVSNSATAALVTPIAINLAVTQGLPPQRFALAMAFAVSTSYVTPLTNAENLLIRETGRYSMKDYLQNGLPLFLLQTAALMLMLTLL